MAQAGATFNKRGPAPANSEAGPSVRAMDARSAPSAPAPRPATADRSADKDGSSAVRYQVGVNARRKLSKPAQYNPEKGTSRHSVGARPRQSVPNPRWRTLSRKTEK